MHDICVKQGWCGSMIDGKSTHVSDFITQTGLVPADEFVTWLIKVENCDPSNLNWQKSW